jgi:hypothetical protein
VNGDPKLVDRSTADALLARALSEPKQEFGSSFLSRLLGFRVSYRVGAGSKYVRQNLAFRE